MATTTFLDLPDELILHIAELLCFPDRCDMRLLSKRIDYLITPMLFERLSSLEPTLYLPEPYTVLSEYISQGRELVFSRCTKTMIISAFSHYPCNRELPWLRLLINLIPTLSNLQSLEWSYWPCKHPVSPLVIDAFNAFESIPSLRELIITVVASEPFPGFTLKSFSRLSSVSINWEHTAVINQDFVGDIADLLTRCPTLQHFTFRIPRPCHPSEAPLLTHIFASLLPTTRLKLRQLDLTGLHVSADDFRAHLHHLFSLKVLRLTFNRHADPPQQNGRICQLLLDNSIYLDELAIDTTHPTGVIDYLSSYSGLERLEFQSRYPGADTPEGVHRFFSSVLPLHRATLRELHLGWSVETPWTRDIAPEDLAQIETCQQLTELSCYVTMTIEPTARAHRLLIWLDTAMKLPRLEYLLFFLTCRYQPPLRMGRFFYDLATMHESEMEDKMKKSTVAAVEKLTANRTVPFQIRVFSPTLGP